jgi:peptide/nickel transport system permease protein
VSATEQVPTEAEARAALAQQRRRRSRRRGVTGVARKLGELVLVLLLVTFATAVIIDLLPGNAAVAILGDSQPPEAYAALEEELGLNQNLFVRYGEWLGNAVQGDLGESIIPPGGEVVDRVSSALPVSVELAILGLGMALGIAIPLALWSAWRPGGRVDRIITTITFGLVSLPSFVAGMVLILLFVRVWPIFPRAEWVRLSDGIGENLNHALLPAFVVALGEIPIFLRVLRGDLIETLQQDYVTAARSRGMSPRRVLVSEALRPSSLSLVTVAGVSLGRLIGSTVIAETLFGLPGIGSLIVSSALSKDIALLQGAVVTVAVIYVLVNAAVDLSYSRLDPRLRRAAA